jgi:hypothetical protein
MSEDTLAALPGAAEGGLGCWDIRLASDLQMDPNLAMAIDSQTSSWADSGNTGKYIRSPEPLAPYRCRIVRNGRRSALSVPSESPQHHQRQKHRFGRDETDGRNAHGHDVAGGRLHAEGGDRDYEEPVGSGTLRLALNRGALGSEQFI